MRSSVAILQYDESAVRLLPSCKADGANVYAPSTRADYSVQLQTADQLREVLPTTGAAIASKLDPELLHGAAIDVAMISIGSKTTTRRSLRRSELKGDCERATHFVRRAALGAFVIRLGTKKKHVNAEMMSRPDAPSNTFLGGDGSIAACQRATPLATEPPPDCQAVLRVELQRIE
jgi:uncharacterized protein